MKNTVTMAELMKQVEAFEKPQNLDEGFASDAQRRAAFAQGYTAKGKKDKKDEEVLDEAKATLSRFGGDRLKSSIMNLAKQRGLKVKDLGKDKIEISGNGKVVMAITLAVQKKDVKINEGPPNTQATPDVAAMRAAGKANELPKIKAKSKQMVAVAKEEVELDEDGHTDVASAIRQCKTMVEDAMQITSKLQTMNPEDSLPSWWTNKLAVSSNSMNKLRDYFLVPTTEEVELDENKNLIKDYEKYMSKGGKTSSNAIDYLMSMPKYKRMTKDQMAKIIGDHRRKGIFKNEVELGENASRAFDDLIKTGGIDKKDFQKAKQLYMKKDLMGLRKFIYNLDTDPLESIMDIISTNDSKAFMKMYPKSKKGEYMSSIAHTHKEEVELDEAKYDLYHKDFSSAMQHAYAMAKKLHGITIDPKEIDDKVATGPKKPSKGKTNSYRLKGKGGAIQVQVANLDDKKFELNMYKEENEGVDLVSTATEILTTANTYEEK